MLPANVLQTLRFLQKKHKSASSKRPESTPLRLSKKVKAISIVRAQNDEESFEAIEET